MEKKHFNLIAYFLISIVIVNAVLNFFINDFKIYTEYLNIYDLLAGFLLFVFLYFVGRIIKNIFHLSSVSIGIVLYLFSNGLFIYEIRVKRVHIMLVSKGKGLKKI